MKNFIKKHPIISYYILTFGWTWAIVFYIMLSGNAKDLNNPTPIFIIGGIISGIAPSLASFIVTGVSVGRNGLHKLIVKFKKKNSFKLYLGTLIIVPTITILTTIISHFTIRTYEFNLVIPMILMGLIWPLFSGFGEEFGWRGYILPKLLSKYTVLESAIILGVIWELWHLPMHYIAYKDYGMYMLPAFILIGFFNLTLQNIIMTYIFVKNNGSLKLMITYHYTITGSSILMSAFLKAEALPVYTILETVISITLLVTVAFMLYFRKNNELNVLKGKI